MDNEAYDKKIFANNLRRYMEANDKKAVDVCSYLGVAKSTVSSWLNAEKMPRMDKVEKLANWLRIQKSDLIEEKSPAISEDDKALLEEVMANPELLKLLRKLKQIEPDRLAALAKLVEPMP